MTRYFFGPASERFARGDLLRQAVAAERAGFDGIARVTLERLNPGRMFLCYRA